MNNIIEFIGKKKGLELIEATSRELEMNSEDVNLALEGVISFFMEQLQTYFNNNYASDYFLNSMKALVEPRVNLKTVAGIMEENDANARISSFFNTMMPEEYQIKAVVAVVHISPLQAKRLVTLGRLLLLSSLQNSLSGKKITRRAIYNLLGEVGQEKSLVLPEPYTDYLNIIEQSEQLSILEDENDKDLPIKQKYKWLLFSLLAILFMLMMIFHKMYGGADVKALQHSSLIYRSTGI
ncbi:hypothetical protein FEM41_04110 [Jejubacter calystegiae]|uniref:Uncharacterized protein n=1 Tax=Jejubacter calystegiae TaxID=2579935 RepID=A0A4P8YED3_9ENTR|nr:hypothetical protein [Jejubacter calystegiae]QCT18891.1 hypothetical protein FEM41_04110 [Jejubacter calystegiae]